MHNGDVNPSEMNVNGAMKSLTWEGKRLTNIGNNIAYKYNSDGLRIEKIVDDTITSYEYEAGKLVRMSIDNEVSSIHKELIFNYDEQGMNAILMKPKIDTKGNDYVVSVGTGIIVGIEVLLYCLRHASTAVTISR